MAEMVRQRYETSNRLSSCCGSNRCCGWSSLSIQNAARFFPSSIAYPNTMMGNHCRGSCIGWICAAKKVYISCPISCLSPPSLWGALGYGASYALPSLSQPLETFHFRFLNLFLFRPEVRLKAHLERQKRQRTDLPGCAQSP